MIAPEGWHLPADLLARVARYKARKPRPVQRAAYRARMLERAEANYRRVSGPIVAASREGAPPNPPEGVS